MRVDDGPLLAHIFLFVCKIQWLFKKVFNESKKDWIKQFFNNISRFIDDLLAINNNGLLNNYAQEIYPSEMVLEQQNPTPNECTFLDLWLWIVESEVCLSMYDKRDDFPFPIVKFTNASSNVDYIRSHDPIHTTAYRELQANDKFSDFSERVAKTIQSMLAQNLMWDIIEKNLRKFLRSYPTEREKYGLDNRAMIEQIKSKV